MLNLVSKASAFVFAGFLVTSACGKQSPGGSEVAPASLENLPLPDVSQSQGIYPSKTVLEDTRNPFRSAIAPESMQWALTEWAATDGNANIASRAAARFYIWATRLASTPPYGVYQMYTAESLALLAKVPTATDAQREAYRLAAIRAYQSCLDNFPNDLNYNADGTSYKIMTPCYQAIVDLGGKPVGDWTVLPGWGGGGIIVVPGH